MQGVNLTTAAFAFSLASMHMVAAAEDGIHYPGRTRGFFASDQMAAPIPATPACIVKAIENYLGEGITIVPLFDRISGFRDEENLKEDIVVVVRNERIVQLSLNVTQQDDGYVFPYSLLASVDYNGSGLIDTFYYPQSNLPNPAAILAGIDNDLRSLCP